MLANAKVIAVPNSVRSMRMNTMNMRIDDLPLDVKHHVDVMPLGFEEADAGRLKKIFEQAPVGERCYTLACPISGGRFDILLVNYDNPTALLEKDNLLGKSPSIPVVAVSRSALSEPPAYHLRGMLVAAKVLSLFNKIDLPSQLATPAPIPQPVSFLKPVQEPPKLPVETVHHQPAAIVPATVVLPKSVEGFRALVVDDSVAIQKSLELNLAALDKITAVDFADTGEMALEKAKAVKYDLIFLDVMMPGIDGYETCTQLRKFPEYKKTPIIMVSGKSSPLDEVKGVIAGCTTYLTKPVQQEAFQKLSRRVLTWLENYQSGGKIPH